MAESQFQIGQRLELPMHFAQPVVPESVRALGEGIRVWREVGRWHPTRQSRLPVRLQPSSGSTQKSTTVTPADSQVAAWRIVVQASN